MTPDIFDLYDVIDATWPAASYQSLGHWTIREGQGGGSRVSAATHDRTQDYNPDPAIHAMLALQQTPIFMIRKDQEALDHMLEERGFVIKDPVNLYVAPIELIATERPRAATQFVAFPPVAVQREIWSEGGIGQARLDIMDRAQCPKATFLGRIDERAAGTAYVGVSNGVAMLHALETREQFRRQGLARNMMRSMGFWARDNGAEHFALLVTQANIGANALYSSLGMEIVGQYHYRVVS